jgi:cyclic pyranopterin phosphate synthase
MDSQSGRQRRRVDYLRLSITDRCNLRCAYCMPPEGIPLRTHDETLSYEEMAEFARVAAQTGISKVRITGGEPLVRKGCAGFVAMLARTAGVADISLTTNGLLLPRFAAELREAGLKRVNVSIDSLERERYARVTRGGDLDEALAGLEAALTAGFEPVKVNALLLRGIEEEVDAFVALAQERPIHVRFIEYMPVDRRHGLEGEFVPAAIILERLRAHHDLQLVDGPYGHGPARYWQVPGSQGTIGFIAGVSGHFCESCNRLRLTADGRLKTCLFSGEEIDVRPLIGRPAELAAAIAAAVSGKSYDRCIERRANERAMSQIGG